MLNTVFLALRIAVQFAGPVFVDRCEAGYCTVLDSAGEALDVRAAALPSCAREGLTVDGSRCYMVPSPFAPALPLTSDVTL